MKYLLVIPLALLLYAIPLHADDRPGFDPAPALLAAAAAEYEAMTVPFEVVHFEAVHFEALAVVSPAAIELAWLPIRPAAPHVERVRQIVPPPHVSSGYLRHAWIDPHRTDLDRPARAPMQQPSPRQSNRLT